MSAQNDAAGGLTLVGASAGSGKTHRLTDEVVRAVDPTRDDAIGPESLVGVTYTRRSAAELGARIRRTLIEAGAHDRAQTLPLAYLGTVHAVSLRLVQEFAIDAGLSPHVDVLPGDEARWLREALEPGMDVELRRKLVDLADRLQLRWNAPIQRHDWLTPVQDIMTLARSNRMPAGSLPGMAERAVAGLLGVMGSAESDGDALDRAMLDALERTTQQLDRIDDGVNKTREVRATVQKALRTALAGQLPWSEWVKLQKLSPAKAVVDVVAPVIAVALRVDRHPRLQTDLRELTFGIYEAARQGLVAYDTWKKQRRVVDFVDMIDRALTLVEQPDVQEELRSRLRCLVVDEFQDTSPVQLALFVRLHQIAGRSTWVGDRKQCIFEFAGADPMLMEAVTQWTRAAKGNTPQLETNWRSRPELVDFCSHLFAAAFERHGYRGEEVVVKAQRATPPKLASLPPLGLWWLDASNQQKAAGAIAEGVRRLIEKPSETPVVDRATGLVRDLRPGDIAVLVATNAEAGLLATELAKRGMRATVARAGLLATPEGTLVRAALAVLVDPRDTLAAAVLEALTGFGGRSPDEWLDAAIAVETARRAARDRGEAQAPAAHSESVARLRGLCAQLDALAPSEALDGVLSTLEVAALCARWPDREQRLANLDALRGLSLAYEERCAQHREAATIAGLLRFFDQAAEERIVRDEKIAADDQHVGAGEGAVTIVTYHRAKGLEWPVVVLWSLDRGERRDAFEVCPETDRPAFDAADPLGGRWIRYWPWPYGQQQTSPLAAAAAASPEGRAVADREERERVRLLYVGFTRARDHLILAACQKAKRAPAVRWLEELCDADGKPLLPLPPAADACERTVVEIPGARGAVLKVQARHWMLGTGGDEPARLANPDTHAWFACPPAGAGERPAYWIAPSRAASEWPDLVCPRVGEVTSIGERLPLGETKGVSWDVVGDAMHAFLAADLRGLGPEPRLERASRLLAASSLEALLGPKALVQAGDQLRAWVDSRWPDATWHREFPVTGRVATPWGARRVQGTIDLLLEAADGVVIVDHKSFPGGAAQWLERALEHATQLAAYAHVLTAAGPRVLGMHLHFPIGAGVVEMRW
jgi:ATP-dependent exoDNAse (exonuclease V) beta subunit